MPASCSYAIGWRAPLYVRCRLCKSNDSLRRRLHHVHLDGVVGVRCERIAWNEGWVVVLLLLWKLQTKWDVLRVWRRDRRVLGGTGGRSSTSMLRSASFRSQMKRWTCAFLSRYITDLVCQCQRCTYNLTMCTSQILALYSPILSFARCMCWWLVCGGGANAIRPTLLKCETFLRH